MSLFSLYGIKEVADVTFWTTGENSYPVLYLDTLKVSTIEETGEQAEARGGKGNAPLIIWDYGKEITLTLEDALFSMKSMQIMQGAKKVNAVTEIDRTKKVVFTKDNGVIKMPDFISKELFGEKGLQEVTVYIAAEEGDVKSGATSVKITSATEVPEGMTEGTHIVVWTEKSAAEGSPLGQKIEISSDTFPGTYKITGDTYARNQETGEDEFFQFIIPLAKINPEQTITMQADGDPSTFSMTVRVLRPASGAMMELVKYK